MQFDLVKLREGAVNIYWLAISAPHSRSHCRQTKEVELGGHPAAILLQRTHERRHWPLISVLGLISML
jgi:hypothetical protein